MHQQSDFTSAITITLPSHVLVFSYYKRWPNDKLLCLVVYKLLPRKEGAPPLIFIPFSAPDSGRQTKGNGAEQAI